MNLSTHWNIFVTLQVNTCGAFMVVQGHVQNAEVFESLRTHIPSWRRAGQASAFLS